jgi:HEAT repeat protein
MDMFPMDMPPMAMAPMPPMPAMRPHGPLPPMLADHAFAPLHVAMSDQDREAERQEREAERKEREREREIELYERATEQIYEGRYDKAIPALVRLAEMKGPRADAALYWKAYAENRLGQRAESLSTIAELTKAYPSSRYLKSAKALEVEVRGAAGQTVTPDSQADEDLKIMAIQAQQHNDPEQAVPLLEKVLEGNSTPRVKANALYVLALSNSPRAREVLKNIARGTTNPDLQLRAIQYLGVHGGPESRAALAEVYAGTSDIEVKRRILRSFMTSGDKARLLTAAQTEQSPELRSEAIRQLGVIGAQEEIWQLYQKESAVDVKKRMIEAMFVSGNATRLIELAKTEKDPQLRRTAIRNLGVMGSKRTGDALVELYSTDKDPENRKAIIDGLFVQGNAAALVALARKEQDMTMKKEIVQRMSNMGDNKIVRDYLAEILNIK